MNSLDKQSPDIFYREYRAADSTDSMERQEHKVLNKLLIEGSQDTQSSDLMKMVFSDRKLNDLDVSNNPIIEYLIRFRSFAMKRQVEEAKRSINTFDKLPAEMQKEWNPRSLRAWVALRREYYQAITAKEFYFDGRKLEQLSDGLQVGLPDSTDLEVRKEFGDEVLLIHSHPTQSSPSLQDLVMLDGALKASAITTPDGLILTKRIGNVREYIKHPVDWFDVNSIDRILGRLLTIFKVNRCATDRFIGDRGGMNTYGKEMLYNVFCIAASRLMQKQILFSNNQNLGLFRSINMPSEILPSLVERIYGRDTSEQALFEEVLDYVKSLSEE